MQIYVLGFAFDSALRNVVLIEKNHPDWQQDRLNGVGGKLENREHPWDGMVREFLEETGCETVPKQWRKIAQISNISYSEYVVMVFATIIDINDIVNNEPSRDEPVISYDVTTLPLMTHHLVSDVAWLVHRARECLQTDNTSNVLVAYPNQTDFSLIQPK
jgi:8-oxo-dGTP diphosphatase